MFHVGASLVHVSWSILSWPRSSIRRRYISTSEEVTPEVVKRSAVMASSATARSAVSAAKVVKPILSRDLDEAKRRARELYRAWYREIPNTGRLDLCNACKVIKTTESFKVERFSLNTWITANTITNLGNTVDTVCSLLWDSLLWSCWHSCIKVSISIHQHQRWS